LRRIDSGAEVTCLGTERGLETRLIPLRGYPLELIPAVPMPRSVTPKLLTVPGRLASAVNAAAAAIDRTRAQVFGRVRRLRRYPGLPRGAAAQDPDRGARGEP
jgi:UDP-N-acetylglucosamine:LPS N-acetylglucosamine transferase